MSEALWHSLASVLLGGCFSGSFLWEQDIEVAGVSRGMLCSRVVCFSGKREPSVAYRIVEYCEQ